MIRTKKFWLALLVIASFMTFGFQAASDVSAEVAADRKPNSYWLQNQGYIERIVFKVITSDELIVQALRASEIDMVGQFVDVSLLNAGDYNDPDIGLTQTRRRGFGHVTYNNAKFPTNIRALRQGFAYALDKIELQQRALGGASYTADSVIVPSLGIWSCEHELADCEFPGGDTYYEARPDKGNLTVVTMGWYDIDGDGWREFFNGTVAGEWSGAAVSTNSYGGDFEYNGYTQLGKTFAEVAAVSGSLGANDYGPSKVKEAYRDTSLWLNLDDPGDQGSQRDFELDIIGSAGASIVITEVVTMSVEAYHSMGIGAKPGFVTFSTLLQEMNDGEFEGVFFAHSNLAPNPTFMQIFVSDSVQNLQETRWSNATFDEIYRTVETSSDENEVLTQNYLAQKILWQEQPKVVMYNNELTTMYRKEKFQNTITVPGTGGFGYWSLAKMYLKDDFFGDSRYNDWPLGGTLYYGLPQPMGSQNTVWDNNAYTQVVMGMLEEGLAARNPQDLTWMSSLAKSWTIEQGISGTVINRTGHEVYIPSGTKVTWELYDNMTWHDGEKVTAEDLAFTYEMLVGNNSPVYFDALHDYIAVNKTGEYTLEVYSNKTGLFEFDNLNIGVYPKHIWNDVPNNDPINYDNSFPIGSGPYKWISRTPGEFVVLERNEDYFRAAQPIPEGPNGGGDDNSTTSVTTTPTGSTDTTGDDNQAGTPGFELLAAVFGMGAITIVAKRRRK